MKGESCNMGLEDANLSKIELCQELQERVPGYVYLEAPIGEDPDKKGSLVSNQKLPAIGLTPAGIGSRDSGIDQGTPDTRTSSGLEK